MTDPRKDYFLDFDEENEKEEPSTFGVESKQLKQVKIR